MTKVNHTVRVRVTGAPPQTLAEFAASMALGSWAQFPMGGLTGANFLEGSASALDYSPKATWDPINRKFVFNGGTHGNTGEEEHIICTADEVTKTFTRENGPQNPGPGNPMHGYYAHTINPMNGRQYVKQMNSFSHTYWTRPGFSGAWTSKSAQNHPGQAATAAFEFHPAMHGGVGALVYANHWGISTMRADNEVWTNRLNRPNGDAMGDLHQASAYNAVAQTVHVGGPRRHWSVDANGNCVQRADFPFDVNEHGQGRLVAGAGTRGLVCISASRVLREYDHVANSWTGDITSLPFTPFENKYFVGAIREYRVLLFVWHNGPSTFGVPYLYKAT